MSLETFQVLSSLPTSLSCTVLGDWLDLKSICRLDSALCKRSKRTTFLNLAQSIECVGNFGTWNNDRLVWLNRRSVKSSEFFLTDSISSDVCEEYLRRFGRHVRTFYLHATSKGSSLHLVAQHCSNIVRFRSYSHSCDIMNCTKILRANPYLVELTIACGLSLTPCLPRLRYLSLWDPVHDNAFCVAIVKLSRHLVFLSLSNTIVTSSIQAARYCPSLKYFQPPNVADIDYTMAEVTKLCVHIQHIDLSCCVKLSDAGIIAIARNVDGLRTIHLTYSHLITNACLTELAQHQHETLEEFSALEIVDSPRATSVAENLQTFNAAAVTLFREKCKKLRIFDWQKQVDWDSELDVALIIPLVLSADRVTTLTLFYVNDDILSAVAATCKQLELLYLYYCTTLSLCSDEVLLQVARSCPTLLYVQVDQSQITRLQQLFIEYPHIQVRGSGNGSVYSYNLQSIYRNDYKNEYP